MLRKDAVAIVNQESVSIFIPDRFTQLLQRPSGTRQVSTASRDAPEGMLRCRGDFGSASSALIVRDFSREQRRSFTVTREILWESEEATPAEVNEKEREFIKALQANNPGIGYNRSPKFRG
jgi:hypothetical protein